MQRKSNIQITVVPEGEHLIKDMERIKNILKLWLKNYNKMVLNVLFERENRASLVVQWLRIHLPMQGTWVQSLVQEDLTFN